LGRIGYAREIGGEIEKVEDDLEMEMRGPSAVFKASANAGKGLATGDAIAGAQGRERFAGKMTVKGEKCRSISRLVFEDDDRAVIERGAIVGKGVDSGVEWGGYGCSGISEKVDTEMNGSALVGGIGTGEKQG